MTSTTTINDASIWGPHFWFFLHTIPMNYPIHPNPATKRKYYDFVMNLPLFLPDTSFGNTFSRFLDEYPVSPYLDTRDSFIYWVYFIHNKINVYIGKEEITFPEALRQYYAHYKPTPVKLHEKLHLQKKHVMVAMLLLMCFFIYVLY